MKIENQLTILGVLGLLMMVGVAVVGGFSPDHRFLEGLLAACFAGATLVPQLARVGEVKKKGL